MRNRPTIPAPVSRHFSFLKNYIFGWSFGNLFLTGNAKRQKALKGKRKAKDEDLLHNPDKWVEKMVLMPRCTQASLVIVCRNILVFELSADATLA